jgi:superfamily II DNA or RNA helicase
LTAETPKSKQISSVQRMKAMQGFPSKEDYAKRLLNQSKNKCILFANTKEQADKLCASSYHSGNKDSKENLESFKKGTITKLSCVLQLNEGVNIPQLKEGIIMHAYGNNRKTAQRLGRLLRLNPDDVATIHILCYKDTIDMEWVSNALFDFDKNKISWYDTELI